MDSPQALHPNAFNFGSMEQTPIETKESEKQVADDDEMAINFVAQQKGWKLIEEFINDQIAELDSIVDQLMANGASFSEIGQKTAVGAVAKAYLNKVKAKVQNARDVVEGNNG